MRHTGYAVEVSAVLELTGQDLVDLYRNGDAHYDARCAQFAHGEVADYLWLYLNRGGDPRLGEYHERRHPHPDVPLMLELCASATEPDRFTLPVKELQLVAKIGEMLTQHPFPGTAHPEHGLSYTFILKHTLDRQEYFNARA